MNNEKWNFAALFLDSSVGQNWGVNSLCLNLICRMCVHTALKFLIYTNLQSNYLHHQNNLSYVELVHFFSWYYPINPYWKINLIKLKIVYSYLNCRFCQSVIQYTAAWQFPERSCFSRLGICSFWDLNS